MQNKMKKQNGTSRLKVSNLFTLLLNLECGLFKFAIVIQVVLPVSTGIFTSDNLYTTTTRVRLR